MKKPIISAVLLLLLVLSLPVTARADVTYPAPGDVEVGTELEHLVASVSDAAVVSWVDGSIPEGLRVETQVQDSRQLIYLRGVPTAVGEYNCVIMLDNSGNIICPIRVTPASPAVHSGADVICFPGSSVQLSVNASAPGGSLSYQWYSSGLPVSTGGSAIAGATDASLQISASAVGVSYYYCIVTNSVGGQSVSVSSSPITLTVEAHQLSSVSVHSMPVKTVYTVGDTLDASGLLLYASYADGSSAVLSEGFELSPLRLDTVGQQTVTVSCDGKSCTFTVTVEDIAEQIDGIGVLTLPDKTHYVAGEALDTAGLSVRVYTNKGHRDVSNGLSCEPEFFDRAGQQTVTVTYGGKSCTFSVTVSAELKPVSLSVSRLPDKRQYSPGQELDADGLVLRLFMNDGSYQEIREGFTCAPTRLDRAGRQDITVSYDGLECRFSVTVEEADNGESSPAAESSPPVTLPPDEGAAPGQSRKSGSSVLVAVIIAAALLALVGLVVFLRLTRPDRRDRLSDRIEEFLSRFGRK